jgi:hypothetical protein
MEERMTSTDVAERVDPVQALEEKSLYDRIDANQLAAIKARWNKLNDMQVLQGLQVCYTLGLNVFADEMYAAIGNGGELLMMVGRNGLLRKAEDFPDYRGYDSGVVYANDYFERVDPDPDAKSLRARAGVIHRQGHPSQRGECVGAWAVAEREGRPPRFFFAPLEDYCPPNPHPKSAWSRNPTVMIDKVPISVVHRTLCNLSGVYLREEVEKLLTREDGAQPTVTWEEERAQIAEVVEALEGDAGLHERLLAAIDALNELSPRSWGLGKVQMTLPGRSREELEDVITQIEEDVDVERARQGATEEEITDAEVVEEPDAETAAKIEDLENRRADLEIVLDEESLPEKERDEALAEVKALDEQIDSLRG